MTDVDTCRGTIHPLAPAVGPCPWCVGAHELQREDDAPLARSRLGRMAHGGKQGDRVNGLRQSYGTVGYASKTVAPPRAAKTVRCGR